jgi:hypothetical protein
MSLSMRFGGQCRTYYYYYYYYLPQLSFHSVAVVLTLVQTKEIRIYIHKQNNTKHSTNNTKHSKYKYTYYQWLNLESRNYI